MDVKIKKPAENTEEIRFEDLDLVYVFSFDLGAPVKAKDLGEWFSRSKLVEGIWIPPSEYRPAPEFVRRKAKELEIKNAEKISEEELIKNEKLMEEINRAHAMFLSILSEDCKVCDPEYLELGRYVRLKLTDLNLRIEDPEFSYLNGLRCELYLLLHDAGVGIVTVWIHLNSYLSTDDLIKIENKLDEAKCIIEDSFGSTSNAKSLDEFIFQNIIDPLRTAATFSSEYGGFDAAVNALRRGDITTDKLKKKLRSFYRTIFSFVCIRKHRCQDGCITAEDAVERHSREIYGILMNYENWKYAQTDAIKEVIKNNLSSCVDYVIFVATEASLFIGSVILYERLKSAEDQELEYRRTELNLVLPMEFLLLSDRILDVYISIYRSKLAELRERRRRGEAMKPSEIIEIREELMYGLEEYNNVLFFVKDPHRKIMEHGKESLMLSRKVNTIISGLQELSDMVRTFYEEEILRRQEGLSRMQTILTVLFGIFGVFQALEFLGPMLGLPNAIAITSTIFLPYPIYKLLSSLYGKKR
jgi:hypothetical protein